MVGKTTKKNTKVVDSSKKKNVSDTPKKVMKDRMLSSSRLRRQLNTDMNGSALLEDIAYVCSFVEVIKENNTIHYEAKSNVKFSDDEMKKRFKDYCSHFNTELDKKGKKGEPVEHVKVSNPLDMLRVLRSQKYRFNASGLNTLNTVLFNMVRDLLANGVKHTLEAGHKTIGLEHMLKNVDDTDYFPFFRSLQTYTIVMDTMKERDIALDDFKDKMRSFVKNMKGLKTEKAQQNFATKHKPEKPDVTIYDDDEVNAFTLYGRLAWNDMKLSDPESYNDLRVSKKCSVFCGNLVSEFLHKFASMTKIILGQLFKNKKTINSPLVRTIVDMICVYNGVDHCKLDENLDTMNGASVTIKALHQESAEKVEKKPEKKAENKSEKKSKKVEKKKSKKGKKKDVELDDVVLSELGE